MTTHPDALPRPRTPNLYGPLVPDAPYDAAPAPIVEVSERAWANRLLNAGKATVDLVCHPFQWEFRYEYRPVKNNPHGRDEMQAKRVFRRKDANGSPLP